MSQPHAPNAAHDAALGRAAGAADAADATSAAPLRPGRPGLAPVGPRASVFHRRRGIMRGLTLIVATTLSLFGTLGQFHFVDRIEDVAEARAQEMRDIESRTETLRTAQSAYFNAQVQGNMLFALNPADRSVNKGIVGDLYKLALYDQAFPFRSILGELAIAGAIEFKAVNDEYARLRDAAMADFGYQSFMAVGEFERAILNQAMTLHGRLQDRYWAAEKERAEAAAEARRRRALLTAVAGAATCLFLLASLLGVKD